MLLIYQDFITENLTVRFTIPVFSVIFKNSAAITNTHPVHIYIKWQKSHGHDMSLSFTSHPEYEKGTQFSCSGT